MIKRTHTCGELTKNDIGSQVNLNGWIAKTRDLGGLIFIDLRDRYGKTQVVFNEELNKDAFICAKKLGLEDGPALMEGLHKVLEDYGKSNRNKYRAVVYYLLTKHFGKEEVYS